jgi:hypothetical protein
MSIAATDELVEALAELRLLFPDWRLGQLVANLALAAGAIEGDAIWEVEDEQLLSAAHRLINRNRGRESENAEPIASPDRGGVKPSPGPTPSDPPRQVS